jgi:hypothetical protein
MNFANKQNFTANFLIFIFPDQAENLKLYS